MGTAHNKLLKMKKTKAAAEEKTNGAQIQNMPPLGRRLKLWLNLLNYIKH
jgi:hypothetical protein